MSAQNAVHTFRKGMVKDLDKSLISADAYTEAINFRPVTSKGLSTGALENIEGNNNMATALTNAATLVVGSKYTVVSGTATYNGTTYTLGQTFTVVAGVTVFTGTGTIVNLNLVSPDGYYIIGSAELRGDLVLFQTNNTNSRIVLVTYNETTEKIVTVTVVYDDSDNNSTGTLGFNTAYPIKAIARYETPNIKKVYWTDGYNHIRYINVARYNTTDGLIKSATNYYIAPDLLEFIPNITMEKAYLFDMITGTLPGGVVQYTYQYFMLNGAETLYAPLSNTIHIVSEPDNLAGSLYYKGDEETGVAVNKGCEVTIPLNDSDRYNKVRLIRLHYANLNDIPTITIVGEIDIDSSMSSVNFKDTGSNIVGELTLEELNIASTDLFVCKDIDTKDNMLFAANITKEDIFDIGDWDARAVRYRKYSTGGATLTDTVTQATLTHDTDCVVTFLDSDSITVTITGFPTIFSIPTNRTVTDVTDVYFDYVISGTAVSGTATLTGSPGWIFTSTHAESTISNISYNPTAPGILTFEINDTGDGYFPIIPDSVDTCTITSISFDYEYTSAIDDISATVYSSAGDPITFGVPTDVTDPADWDTAGWSNALWATQQHDGINYFNDLDNDYTATLQYKYQSDGNTLGAEGPNLKIGFTTEAILIDSDNHSYSYYAPSENTAANKSYTSMASPFKSGKRSWQRDEIYRLYLVFFDERGRASLPKWVCDLRMPSLHDGGDYYKLADLVGTETYTRLLYPTIYLRSFPTNAVSAQLLRVQRGANDRTIVTQGMVVPTTASPYTPDAITANVTAASPVNKIVSPEINITKNVSFKTGDFLDYVTDFSDVQTEAFIISNIDSYRARENASVARTANERKAISAASYITPSKTAVTVGGSSYTNFNSTTDTYGSSGLLCRATNASWTAGGVNHVLVNYKRNLFDSQYGGNTFNKRINNIAIPASDVIEAIETTYTCYNGDTFINYFCAYTTLYDLTQLDGDSALTLMFFPVESSINLDLQHGFNMIRSFIQETSILYLFNAQETAGEWTNASSHTYKQLMPMYQYNTVYSQDSSARSYINISTENAEETGFDCMVRVSQVKTNGESVDSWTKFLANDFIEVETSHGSINAIANINNKLLYWQDNAFGILSVNDRSLIADSLNSQLVLGTGGVLDRYDYITTSVGTSSRRSVVPSQAAVYWYYDKEKSIYRFAEGLENLSKSMLTQSWFTQYVTSSHTVHGIYNPRYNEVLMTFYNSGGTSYTIMFNETINAFTAFSTLTPRLYIPIRHGYLTSYFTGNADQLFYCNSALKARCLFNSLIPGGTTDSTTPSASNLTILVNDNYPNTKVFDNIFFDTTTTDSNGYEVNLETFDQIRCRNNYQNTDYVNLVYKTNLERRERIWTTVVPRNKVDIDYPALSTDVLSAANLDSTRLFKERMRDKFMFIDFVYNNNNNYRIVLPYIGVRYRISPR